MRRGDIASRDVSAPETSGERRTRSGSECRIFSFFFSFPPLDVCRHHAADRELLRLNLRKSEPREISASE